MQPPNIVIQTGGENFAPAFSAPLRFTAATLRAALHDVTVDTAEALATDPLLLHGPLLAKGAIEGLH